MESPDRFYRKKVAQPFSIKVKGKLGEDQQRMVNEWIERFEATNNGKRKLAVRKKPGSSEKG
jgi:hypothetical protein